MKQLFIALTAILLLSTVACSKKDKNKSNVVGQCAAGEYYAYDSRYGTQRCMNQYDYSMYGQGTGTGQFPGQPGGNHQAYCQYWAPQYQQMPNFMQQCLQYCQQNPQSCF